jgi:hypothetical protein
LSYERALAAIKADLDRIPDASRWCYHNSWPMRPDRDRPTPLRDPTFPVDFVPGAKFDIGIGVYLCRSGWVAAREHLAEADRDTAAILAGLAPRAGCSPLRIRDEDRHEEDIPKYAVAVRRRVTLIQLARNGAGPDIREWVVESLTNPYGPVWRAAEAYAELTTHHHRAGDDTKPTTIPMCKICSLRPAEPKKAGKCHACYQRLWRDGTQAVVEIRAETQAELERVKQRRSRQCGYGAA